MTAQKCPCGHFSGCPGIFSADEQVSGRAEYPGQGKPYSTQKQALNGMFFLARKVFGQTAFILEKQSSGHTQRRPPVVRTRDEVQAVLVHLENPWKHAPSSCMAPASVNTPTPPANGSGRFSSPPQPSAPSEKRSGWQIPRPRSLHATPVQRRNPQGRPLQTRHLPHPATQFSPLRSSCLPGYTINLPWLLRRATALVFELSRICSATRMSPP